MKNDKLDVEFDGDGWCYDLDKAPIGKRGFYLLKKSERPYFLNSCEHFLYTDVLTRHVYNEDFSDVGELFIDHKLEKEYQRQFCEEHKLKVIAWQPLPPAPKKKA